MLFTSYYNIRHTDFSNFCTKQTCRSLGVPLEICYRNIWAILSTCPQKRVVYSHFILFGSLHCKGPIKFFVKAHSSDIRSCAVITHIYRRLSH